jgi:hypothetical protein
VNILVNTRETYLVCQHEGSSRAHRKKGEPDRLGGPSHGKGRIKKDDQCLSRIDVHIKSDGSVQASYFHDHDHPIVRSDLAHQGVPKEIWVEVRP